MSKALIKDSLPLAPPWRHSVANRSMARGRGSSRPEVHPLIRFSLYAFIFSVPFEAVDIGFGAGHFTLSKLVGYLFLGAAVLQPRVSLRVPPISFWLFSLYVLMVAGLGLALEPQYRPDFTSRLFMMVQMLVLFGLCCNLLRDRKSAVGAFWTLAVSCLALASLMLFESAGSPLGVRRLTAFGMNPNTTANVLSLGLLALVGLAYGLRDSDLKTRLLAWTCYGIFAMAIIRTGSRGALVALLLGFMVYFVQRVRMEQKFRLALIVLMAGAVLVVTSIQIEEVRGRWETTIQEGSFAGRERIFPAAVGVFLDSPLYGWGPVRHYHELGQRLGVGIRDPHNVYLWVLIETGLLGGIPFLLGLWLCFRNAWRGRSGHWGVLPLSLLVALLAVNMKGTWHNRKLFWVVLAFAQVSALHMTLERPSRLPAQPGEKRPRTPFQTPPRPAGRSRRIRVNPLLSHRRQV